MQTAADFTVWGGAMDLIDRDAERTVLDRLVASVGAGESQALVVSGEAGVGKTALLDYLAGNASGCQIARAAGVQCEMELAFAAVHQLCAPMLDRLQRLPVPQRDAVRTAFGMSGMTARVAARGTKPAPVTPAGQRSPAGQEQDGRPGRA